MNYLCQFCPDATHMRSETDVKKFILHLDEHAQKDTEETKLRKLAKHKNLLISLSNRCIGCHDNK